MCLFVPLYPAPSSRGYSVGVSYCNILLDAPIKKIPPELVLQRDLTNNSLSTVQSSPFRRFSGGIEPFLADAFRGEYVDVSPLGEEPHEDAFAKDVSTDAPAAVVALSRFRGGQPVEDSFQGEAFVNEFEVDLFPEYMNWTRFLNSPSRKRSI